MSSWESYLSYNSPRGGCFFLYKAHYPGATWKKGGGLFFLWKEHLTPGIRQRDHGCRPKIKVVQEATTGASTEQKTVILDSSWILWILCYEGGIICIHIDRYLVKVCISSTNWVTVLQTTPGSRNPPLYVPPPSVQNQNRMILVVLRLAPRSIWTPFAQRIQRQVQTGW